MGRIKDNNLKKLLKRQCTYRFILSLFVVLSNLSVQAYDSPKVPPYLSPWIETTRLDDKTLFLWKFSTGDDVRIEEDYADNEDVVEREAAEPELFGDAKSVEKTGRFGSGLVLDGSGYASGTIRLASLLTIDGGFSIDYWFQPKAAKEAMTLLAIPAKDGKPLLSVIQTTDSEISLKINEIERLKLPLSDTVENWHFIAVSLTNINDKTSIKLIVDGREINADKPDWLKLFSGRLGSSLSVGGGKGVTGLKGVVDEVRLSSGIRYFYPWNFGYQEFTQNKDTELKSPYFRQGTVLTRFNFDGTITPTVFAGLNVEGKVSGKDFKPGIKGQALDLTNIDKSGFKMNGFYILPEKKDGTIEFLFRPLDWNNFFVGQYDGRDVKFYHLMKLTAKDALYNHPTKDIELFRGRAGRDSELRWEPFHPGTWSHVLITIKDGHESVYINGKAQKLWQGGYVTQGHPFAQEPLKKWLERTDGKDDGSWALTFLQCPTLVDEFSVYSWSMNAEEAWNAYARWLPDAPTQMKPLPVFRVDFDYFAHSWDMKEKLTVKVTCLPVDDVKPASADVEVKTENGEMLLSVDKQPLDETGNTIFTLKRALPFGRYPVTVRSRSTAGTVMKEEKYIYNREKPVWLENNLGKENTIPKPWIPVAVDGRQMKIIDRAIQLGTNGLPAQIETRKQQVLAKPMVINAVSDVGAGALDGKEVKFVETLPHRAAWQTKLVGAGLTANLDAWMEFDGLLYCAITLKPTNGNQVKLDELDIDVPMDAKIATQLLANAGGNDFRASWITRKVPEGHGPNEITAGESVWNSLDKPYPAFTRALGVTNFMPHIWIGNDDVGLYFGAENDRGWTVDGPKPAQEIIRRDGDVIFRMNVIREPVVINETGQRFHFIMLPTPAKREPEDWRKQMAIGGVNFGSCDTFGGFDLKTDPADANPGDAFLLEPRSWEHAAKMAPQCRAKWGRCILYADASFPGLGASFRDWNHDLWAGTGRLAWTQECEDYAVWAVNEYIKRGLIDGIYWDDISVGYTLSLASTAYTYEKSENGRRVGFTALAQRRLNMRLWRLFEAAGMEPCIWAHMTVCYEVPLFSFCRYLSNGEFVTGVDYPKSRDGMDFWSSDTLRILGGSSKWGTGVSFLSTLPRTLPLGEAVDQWSYPQKRTETGMFMTSDIMTIADGLASKLKDVKFFEQPVTAWPWWKSAEVLTVDVPKGAQILANVYTCTDKAYVIIANRDREIRDVTMNINLAKIFPEAKGVSWRDIDPGLKPPKKVRRTEEEMKNDEPDDLENMQKKDLFDDTPTEKEQLDALILRIDGNAAKAKVRPRDYRVFEVKPVF